MTKVPDLSGHGGLILDNATRGGWSRLKGQDVKGGFSRGPIMPNPSMEDIWPLTHKANSSLREPWGRNSVRTSRCVLCAPISLGYRSSGCHTACRSVLLVSILGMSQPWLSYNFIQTHNRLKQKQTKNTLFIRTEVHNLSYNLLNNHESPFWGCRSFGCHTTCRTITCVSILGMSQL